MTKTKNSKQDDYFSPSHKHETIRFLYKMKCLANKSKKEKKALDELFKEIHGDKNDTLDMKLFLYGWRLFSTGGDFTGVWYGINYSQFCVYDDAMKYAEAKGWKPTKFIKQCDIYGVQAIANLWHTDSPVPPRPYRSLFA